MNRIIGLALILSAAGCRPPLSDLGLNEKSKAIVCSKTSYADVVSLFGCEPGRYANRQTHYYPYPRDLTNAELNEYFNKTHYHDYKKWFDDCGILSIEIHPGSGIVSRVWFIPALRD